MSGKHSGQPVQVKEALFGFSTTEIQRAVSVVNVSVPSVGAKFGPSDIAMGPMSERTRCPTCNNPYGACQYHEGSIECVVPIPHPNKSLSLFLRILSVLSPCGCHGGLRIPLSDKRKRQLRGMDPNARLALVEQWCANIVYCGQSRAEAQALKQLISGARAKTGGRGGTGRGAGRAGAKNNTDEVSDESNSHAEGKPGAVGAAAAGVLASMQQHQQQQQHAGQRGRKSGKKGAELDALSLLYGGDGKSDASDKKGKKRGTKRARSARAEDGDGDADGADDVIDIGDFAQREQESDADVTDAAEPHDDANADADSDGDGELDGEGKADEEMDDDAPATPKMSDEEDLDEMEEDADSSDSGSESGSGSDSESADHDPNLEDADDDEDALAEEDDGKEEADEQEEAEEKEEDDEDQDAKDTNKGADKAEDEYYAQQMLTLYERDADREEEKERDEKELESERAKQKQNEEEDQMRAQHPAFQRAMHKDRWARGGGCGTPFPALEMEGLHVYGHFVGTYASPASKARIPTWDNETMYLMLCQVSAEVTELLGFDWKRSPLRGWMTRAIPVMPAPVRVTREATTSSSASGSASASMFQPSSSSSSSSSLCSTPNVQTTGDMGVGGKMAQALAMASATSTTGSPAAASSSGKSAGGNLVDGKDKKDGKAGGANGRADEYAHEYGAIVTKIRNIRVGMRELGIEHPSSLLRNRTRSITWVVPNTSIRLVCSCAEAFCTCFVRPRTMAAKAAAAAAAATLSAKTQNAGHKKHKCLLVGGDEEKVAPPDPLRPGQEAWEADVLARIAELQQQQTMVEKQVVELMVGTLPPLHGARRVAQSTWNTETQRSAKTQRTRHCIAAQLQGKDGLVRRRIHGKRTFQSGRTVLSTLAQAPYGMVRIPAKFASTLSTNRMVCSGSAHRALIMDSLRAGKAIALHHRGLVRHADYALPDTCVPADGATIERQLRTGDAILLNRQPSLHAGAFLGNRAYLPHERSDFASERQKNAQAHRSAQDKTVGTTPHKLGSLGGDHDGDEGNIQNPNTVESAVETRELSSDTTQIRSMHGGYLNFQIIQHARLGVHFLANSATLLSRSQFTSLLSSAGEFDEYYALPTDDWANVRTSDLRHIFLAPLHHLPTPTFVSSSGTELRKEQWTGWQLLSALLPYGFGVSYGLPVGTGGIPPPQSLLDMCVMGSGSGSSSGSTDGTVHESVPRLRILSEASSCTKGMGSVQIGSTDTGVALFLGGKIDGEQFASANFLFALCQDAGDAIGVHFLHRVERVATEACESEGCSIGRRDTELSADATSEVQRIQTRTVQAFASKDLAHTDLRRVDFAEQRARDVLDAGHAAVSSVTERDLAQNQQFRAHSTGHGALDLIQSRAKGSRAHVLALAGSIGQQYASGARLPGNSAHTHMTYGDPRMHGLIPSNLAQGYRDQREYFCAAMPAREGIVHTGLSTAEVGYFNARMALHMANLRSEYDGSVRTDSGEIVQVLYGNNGLAPNQMEHVSLDLFPLCPGASETVRTLWHRVRALRAAEFAHARVVPQDIWLPFSPLRVWPTALAVASVSSIFTQDNPKTRPMTVKTWDQMLHAQLCKWKAAGFVYEPAHPRCDFVLWAALQDVFSVQTVQAYFAFDSPIADAKQILTEGVAREALEYVHGRLVRSRALPMQAVGVLAAQATSHSSTQTTLKLKHAGQDSMLHLVSAFNRIVNVCKQTPLAPRAMTLRLHKPYNTDGKAAHQLAVDIVDTRLANYVTRTEVFQPDEAVPSSDESWWQAAFALAPPTIQTLFGTYPRIRIELDAKRCKRSGLSEVEAASLLMPPFKKGAGAIISGYDGHYDALEAVGLSEEAKTSTSPCTPVIYVVMDLSLKPALGFVDASYQVPTAEPLERETALYPLSKAKARALAKNKKRSLALGAGHRDDPERQRWVADRRATAQRLVLLHYVSRVLTEVQVRGVKHVRDAVAVWNVNDREWVVETRGSNLAEAVWNPMVHGERSTCDYIKDRVAVLGLDSATVWVQREFEDMVRSAPDGNLIAPHHLLLGGAAMSYTGQMVPRTRNGQKMKSSVRVSTCAPVAAAAPAAVPATAQAKAQSQEKKKVDLKLAAITKDNNSSSGNGKLAEEEYNHVFESLFENPLGSAGRACAEGHKDGTRGPIERHMFGKITAIGPGGVSVLVPSKALRESHEIDDTSDEDEDASDQKNAAVTGATQQRIVPRQVPCRTIGLAFVQQYIRINRFGELVDDEGEDAGLVSSARPLRTSGEHNDDNAWQNSNQDQGQEQMHREYGVQRLTKQFTALSSRAKANAHRHEKQMRRKMELFEKNTALARRGPDLWHPNLSGRQVRKYAQRLEDQIYDAQQALVQPAASARVSPSASAAGQTSTAPGLFTTGETEEDAEEVVECTEEQRRQAIPVNWLWICCQAPQITATFLPGEAVLCIL